MPEPDNTRLTGPWLWPARLGWGAVVTAVLVTFVAAIPARYDQLLRDPYLLQHGLERIGLSVRFFSAYGTLLDILTGAVFFGLAIALFWSKSDDWVVILVSLTLSVYLVAILPVTTVLVEIHPAWTTPLLILRGVGIVLMGTTLYILPDGRFIPAWTKWMVVPLVAYILVWFLRPELTPPTAFTEIRTASDWLLLVAPLFGGFGTIAWAQAIRYRRYSTLVQRQQTKWVVVGLISSLVGLIAISLPLAIFPQLRASGGVDNVIYLMVAIPLTLLSLSLFPLSIAIAVFRYRLWDIELLVNRALVYTALTGTLAVIYFGGVVALQAAFHSLTGQDSTLAIVLSTLAIAALFNPLRSRIQRDIDRLFYRQRYDAVQALQRFTAVTRVEVDLARLSQALLEVVEENLKPSKQSLWLKSGDE
jgi:hypothetical protein